MKLSFSTKNVSAPSFKELCDIAVDYGFDSIEIFGSESEIKSDDGIFSRFRASDAKRWLINRHISVSALTYPELLSEDKNDYAELEKYIEKASDAGIENLIVSVEAGTDREVFINSIMPAIRHAEKCGVTVLLESSGDFADTKVLVSVFRSFASSAVGACWNIRQTHFGAGESAEDTITNLGAYIGYVRMGDMNGGNDCLIGEGDLNVPEFLAALSSLNYSGSVECMWNGDITDYDIVLTHFASYMRAYETKNDERSLQFNRSHTGTFPFKRYDVINKTFSQVLDVMAETYPDQYAFKYTTLDYTRTYSEFRNDVDRVAAAFISLGVKPGHHVAVWATNIPQWFLAFWAATKIGAVLVTVNTAYKIREAEYLLRQSDTHTLVMIENCKDSDYKAIIEELCPELKDTKPGEPLYSAALPFLRNIVTVGFSMDGALTWEKMLERADRVPLEEVRRRAALVKPDDVANMQYTSGTTGFPKGVMLTHSNIVNNGKIIGDRMDMSTADRMMIQVPMFHCFGMVLSMTSMMTHGGTLCPMPYFSPKSSLACITNEKITCFNGVPTMFIAMFAHEDFAKTDFSHMRTGIMAGANCPPDLMRRAADEMNMTEILSVYGQTESSPGCTMGEVNEDLWHRVETVGSAFPGVECKIIDPETGEDLPDGENGEFVARGYNIMKGYYKMPKATAAAIDKDGWLHTGDICCRTPDGYYKVTGRLKDMIIRGGENIYPREIEEFYLSHPKIKDVQVVGVPDKRYGEEACAWIILKDGETADETEMTEYGVSRIARHKVPRYFIFSDSFPMNAAGKILKYKMREDSIQRLGLDKK